MYIYCYLFFLEMVGMINLLGMFFTYRSLILLPTYCIDILYLLANISIYIYFTLPISSSFIYHLANYGRAYCLVYIFYIYTFYIASPFCLDCHDLHSLALAKRHNKRCEEIAQRRRPYIGRGRVLRAMVDSHTQPTSLRGWSIVHIHPMMQVFSMPHIVEKILRYVDSGFAQLYFLKFLEPYIDERSSKDLYKVVVSPFEMKSREMFF